MSEPKTFPVVFMSPSELKPYFRNNKRHYAKQVMGIARMLRQHGFDQPIVVDKDMVIIKGHGRYLASLDCRFEQVPVVVRTDLTETEVNASRIADNKSFSMSAIDMDASRDEIMEFADAGGVGAEFYFDFLRPESPMQEAAAPKSTGENKVDGTLVSCPKCTHTFMEV